MRTGYAWRPVSLYNTVHTDSFTALIIIIHKDPAQKAHLQSTKSVLEICQWYLHRTFWILIQSKKVLKVQLPHPSASKTPSLSLWNFPNPLWGVIGRSEIHQGTWTSVMSRLVI